MVGLFLVGGLGCAHDPATPRAAAPTGHRETRASSEDRDPPTPDRGRPAVVPGPPVLLRFTPAVGERFVVQGAVAYRLEGGSVTQVEAEVRWEVAGREEDGTVRLLEQLERASISARGLQSALPYVTSPDGQRVAWRLDPRGRARAPAEILSAGDPARALVAMQLPELVHVKIGLAYPEGPVAPGDRWIDEGTTEVPTQFGGQHVTHRVEHQLLKVVDGEAWVWLEGRLELREAELALGMRVAGTAETWGLCRTRVQDGVPVMFDLREQMRIVLSGAGPRGWERSIRIDVRPLSTRGARSRRRRA